MNIIDRIVMNLYLWRFPQKPLEQKKEIKAFKPQVLPVRTVHGVCWCPERSLVNGIADKETIKRKIVESMVPELSGCLGNTITTSYQDEFGTLRIEGSLDVVIRNNELKFGD